MGVVYVILYYSELFWKEFSSKEKLLKMVALNLLKHLLTCTRPFRKFILMCLLVSQLL